MDRMFTNSSILVAFEFDDIYECNQHFLWVLCHPWQDIINITYNHLIIILNKAGSAALVGHEPVCCIHQVSASCRNQNAAPEDLTPHRAFMIHTVPASDPKCGRPVVLSPRHPSALSYVFWTLQPWGCHTFRSFNSAIVKANPTESLNTSNRRVCHQHLWHFVGGAVSRQESTLSTMRSRVLAPC